MLTLMPLDLQVAKYHNCDQGILWMSAKSRDNSTLLREGIDNAQSLKPSERIM